MKQRIRGRLAIGEEGRTIEIYAGLVNVGSLTRQRSGGWAADLADGTGVGIFPDRETAGRLLLEAHVAAQNAKG